MHHIPQKLLDHLGQLPKGLGDHIQRVRHVARELAQCNRIDPERAELGAAGHDIARALSQAELLSEARRLRMSIHPVEEALPILLHGPVAARLLRQEFGVTDEEVLHGVHWHSTANRGLSPLGRLIFLADKLDPHKIRRYPHHAQVRDLALQDLDRAVLQFLNSELARFVQDGGLIHPASIEARNELLLRGRGSHGA